MTQYIEPAADGTRYTCPDCGTLVQAERIELLRLAAENSLANTQWRSTRCTDCRSEIVWERTDGTLPLASVIDGTGIVYFRRWPLGQVGPLPAADMPVNVRTLYDEARSVGAISNKSAAALLRLALQELLIDLKPAHADNINQAIGALVKDGLDPQVQMAMDVIRVVGNNAVHPGEIRLDDDTTVVASLFELTNLIVEQMIERPARVKAMFEALPPGAREQIERRDAVPE
jgi:hypothetical protein